MATSEQCVNCKFYRPAVQQANTDNWGECHFAAPLPSVANAPVLNIWPRINNADWCGQWAAIS